MRSVSAVLLACALLHSAAAAWVKPRHAIDTELGWFVRGVTTSVTYPRTLVFDNAGRLLVLQQKVGIIALTLNADGSVKSTAVVKQDSNFNHGLTLSPDGKKLYASSSDAVWSWDYDAAANKLTNQKTLVTGMDQEGHSSRTILISAKHPELLYVSRGSSGNIDTIAADPASGRSTIKAYNITSVPDGGYDQASQGAMVAYGARNEVGIVEDAAGVLWGVENSADEVVRVINGVRTDVHTNNPAEKLHSFGDVTAVSAQAIEVKNYGYPYCLSVWDPSAFPAGDPQEVGDFFVQESTGNITDAICDTAVKPKLLFPAHTAPLDIKFSPDDGNDAFVAFHGSWNREPPIGYSVSIVPGKRDGSGAWSPSADLKSTTGFQDILKAPNLSACPSNCFRPTALVWSPSGDRLYVASDTSNEIILLQRGSGPNPSDAIGRRAQVPFAQFFRRLFGEL